MPGGIFQLGGLAFISITSTYVRNTRVMCMIAMVSLSLIGMIMVYTVNNEHKYTRLAGIWLSAIFAADIPIALSLITSNVGGFTKRATVSAMLFIGYCTGNIIGPQFFYTREKPKYPVSEIPKICMDIGLLTSENRPASKRFFVASLWACSFSAVCLHIIYLRIAGETKGTDLQPRSRRRRSWKKIFRIRPIDNCLTLDT
jgi:hypothetical protein